jgi:hypothetical protein
MNTWTFEFRSGRELTGTTVTIAEAVKIALQFVEEYGEVRAVTAA